MLQISTFTLIRNIKTLRRDLLIIFLISFFIIFLIDFWLINTPELFTGGAKIGQIVYNLCFAYISSFIFYFLVVHIKNQKDKDNLYSYISGKTYVIINQAKELIKNISKAANVTLTEEYPNENELKDICLSINPNTKAPLLLNRIDNFANWIQYFNINSIKSKESITRICSKIQYLDSEFIYKLARIEDCGYYFHISSLLTIPIISSDISFLNSLFADYFELIKDLENYYKKNLKEYSKNKTIKMKRKK